MLPSDVEQDAALRWLEATIDARLRTARKRERLRRTAGALLTTLAGAGVGFSLGGLL